MTRFDFGDLVELRQKLNLNTTGVSALSASDRRFTGTVQIIGSGVTVSTTTNASGNAILLSAAAGAGAAMSVGVSTGGNTAGNTTVQTGSRFVLAGAGAATLSQATAAGSTTVTISVPTQTVQTQDVLSVGVSTGGNTAGNTTVNTGSRFVLAGIGEISLSQSTAAGATTISISAPNDPAFSAGISNLGNTAGTSGTVSNQLVLVGTNNITLSGSTGAGGATISISGASGGGGGGGGNTLQSIMNLQGMELLTRLGTSNATFAIVPLVPGNGDHGMPGAFTGTQFGIYLFGSNTATGSSSGSGTHSYSFGIYTRTGGTFSLLNSASTSFAFAANASNTSLYHGTRLLTLNSSQWSASLTFAENSVYYLGYWMRTSNQGHALSWIGQSIGTTGQYSGLLYTSTATATSMGLGVHVGGMYNTSFSSAMPTSIAIFNTSLNRANAVANFIPYVKIES